jgi:ElaB/YqjD/DUF883 family membrane-anchored ribosome-binding protein
MTMPNDRNAGSPTGMVGTEAGDEARGGGTGARAQIREVKDQVVDQAKNSFRQARDSAGTSLSQSRSQAADRITGIAAAVRGTSERLRSDNQAGVANLTDSLADQVERLSSYLRDRDLGEVRRDLEQFARRQPAVAVGVALALGMLGARFIKSSQRQGGSSGRSDGDDGGSTGFDTGTGRSGSYGMSSQPAGGGYGGA